MNKRGIFRLLGSTPHGVFETLENMYNLIGSPQLPIWNPVVLASAAGLNVISYAYTIVSGTNAMTLIKVPAGFRGSIILIPTGAFTGATGGTAAYDGVNDTIPIGLAFTAVVGKALILSTNGLLWYPNYVA